MEQLTFLSEAHLANPSLSQDDEEAWMTRVATSPSHILPFLTEDAPPGWSGRTSPASCQMMADGRLAPASGSRITTRSCPIVGSQQKTVHAIRPSAIALPFLSCVG